MRAEMSFGTPLGNHNSGNLKKPNILNVLNGNNYFGMREKATQVTWLA